MNKDKKSDIDDKPVFDDAGSLSSASETSGTGTAHSSSQNGDPGYLPIEILTKRTKLSAIFVLVLSATASACFLAFGITTAKAESAASFETRAYELARTIENTWRDYEHAALSIHNICRRSRNTTRKEFREFYEYLIAGGLEFESAQCCPNVTLEERPAYEKAAREFYDENYPSVEYNGFIGFIPDGVTGDLIVVPSPELPFYWPVHYLEPVLPNAPAIDLDLYSYPSQKNEIDLAVTEREPVLSKRLHTVQETEENAYSVIVYHPGIFLETEPDDYPTELSLILVRIPSLLSRVSEIQEENLAVYLYDTTVLNTGGDAEFLGSAAFTVIESSNGREEHTLKLLPEIDIETFYKQYEESRVYEEEVAITPSGSWHITVVPVDDSYDPNIAFVIFGGCMIFAAGLGLAAWMFSNNRRMIQIHQAKKEAEVERAIVSSLFPANIRNRLFQTAGDGNKTTLMQMKAMDLSRGEGMEAYKASNFTSEGLFGSKPIADFHPAVTIMCADLVGFTAWSSAREPSQVFTLLEVIYHSFDTMAKKRRVFKVETVGDCYVAAAGLPEARPDHAVVMAKFAHDCLKKMHLLVAELEVTLGPDTANLAIRLGLHSGAVTAGVLRGDKGRFQLFGDTINTASRMESTGVKNRIHVSWSTAALLKDSGKNCWLRPRGEKVDMKGKGTMETFWLVAGSNAGTNSSTTSAAEPMHGLEEGSSEQAKKMTRLVKWNVEELCRLVKLVVATRDAKGTKSNTSDPESLKVDRLSATSEVPFDEVRDVITLPKFNAKEFKKQITPDDVVLDPEVLGQLSDYVTKISLMYCDNPFHNFEHASHVALSVTKMLTRIVDPKHVLNQDELISADATVAELGLGITGDPLTHLAAFFSAMIHDADHPGVPNTTLAEEDPLMCKHYKGKSVAEQKSMDIAWDLLMEDDYRNMRQCIFGNREEVMRFRQLVVNMVMATDVMDKELGALRKERWNIAFSPDSGISHDEEVNRKATIVIEHLIQASDVSHTMQHWHVYKKWNERLFMELYRAYKQGRIKNDPSEGWYQGEMGFLDYYVIPLAKKLGTCGVFGVSSDEFRIYAQENRKEWELKGKEIVQEYVKQYEAEFHNDCPSHKIMESLAETEDSDSSSTPSSTTGTNVSSFMPREMTC